MFITFIVNPRAGGGLLRRRMRRFSAALPRSALQYDVQTTAFRGHAVGLAREAAGRSDIVVAVGGDGTVNEVVSGMIQSGRSAHLGVIPAGTGNDFAKMLSIPRDPAAALSSLRFGTPTRVDYGLVRWTGREDEGEAVFVNAAGAGIDAQVAAAASRIRLLGGTPRYVAAVLRTLSTWSAPHLIVEAEQDGEISEIGRSEHLLILAGNGKCAAGGFYLTPGARIDDGKLDACVIRDASLRRILQLIPAVLRGGKHVGAPEVTLIRADRLVVRSTTPLPIQADGEVLTSDALKITFEVVVGGLSVIQPVKP